MNFAVISSDSYSHYAFFAPLTAAVWKARGYTPLVLLVGTEAAWQADWRSEIIVEHLADAGASVHFLGDFPGHRAATAAQVSRLYACALPGVEPDDYLLTSDVDMWPLGSWVGGGRDEARDFHIWYSNAYEGSGKVHFPMCYLGARAQVWREVMVKPTVEVLSILEQTTRQSIVDAVSARALTGFALIVSRHRPSTADDLRDAHSVNDDKIPLNVWGFDETYFGECLSAWPGYPAQCQFIPRDMRADGQKRIDRAGWVEVKSLDGYADAHLPRPGYGFENWARVRKLFRLAVPERGAWADSYWRALVGTR